MAQLFFRYGAMASGKSIEILKVAHNYEVQQRRVLLLTSALDNRSGVGEIASRIGMQRAAQAIQTTDDLFELISQNKTVAAVLIDEAQFMTKAQVLQLTRVVDELNIPVLTFGLKNDAFNQLFPGSEALLIYADKIEEMKTLCSFCGRKAIMNLRISNGQPVYEGEQVQIGGDEAYMPVCRKHYNHPDLQALARRTGLNSK
ncbi:thymidine kinase [Weissella paramesenteroides]|jgi:thymidine kinase|uniref:Thymidine kinase n=1 Tax=Weissella paramesenteroides TaxID=1249 RepID=A0ABD4XFV8_WEIPA|nr:thymidine kinase [Weissella paramesenteroides]KAA8441930.1 thymidine kinase [Weissella paramesenteroides]KAA8442174.1 thymidine kinase [Weissella paramesenteroides]KAA8443567.1 thymidine kinase [Weissella paramesenteroides]KAA8447071.1 thymidine kinase [Weissella paramesenteroides]KAA8447479.1 thymidine kinase [Weissella paramesenteroides]